MLCKIFNYSVFKKEIKRTTGPPKGPVDEQIQMRRQTTSLHLMVSQAFPHLSKIANLLLWVKWKLLNIEDRKSSSGDRIFSFPSSPIYETSLYFRMVQRMVKQPAPADVKDLAGPEGEGC